MGEIFASGLLRAGWQPEELKLAVRREERARELEYHTGIETLRSLPETVGQRDVLVVAVKPKDVPTVLAEISDIVTPAQTVVSIAAGVPTVGLRGVAPRCRGRQGDAEHPECRRPRA